MKRKENYLTKLGEYLSKRSTNHSEVSRRTGLSVQRIGQLTNNPTARLTTRELYLIALAIKASPCEMLDKVCEGVKLKGPNAKS